MRVDGTYLSSIIEPFPQSDLLGNGQVNTVRVTDGRDYAEAGGSKVAKDKV